MQIAILQVVASLKLSRGEFAFIVGIANAANALLVPLITMPAVAAFTAIAINLAIVYLATEQKEAPAA